MKLKMKSELKIKTKNGFFEKIDKLLARLTNKKRRHKLLVEVKGAIITDSVDFKRIKRNEQLYPHKFDNLDEMEQFLENQSTKTNREIGHLNRPKSIKSITKTKHQA